MGRAEFQNSEKSGVPDAETAMATKSTNGAAPRVAVSSANSFPEVDRRSNLSRREFRNEYLKPGKPVVITDAMDSWAAKESWTFDFFKTRYGDYPVKVWKYDQDVEFSPDAVETIPLAGYVEGVTGGDWKSYPYYLRDNWKMVHDNPELKGHYQEPPYFYDWYKHLPAFLRMPYPRIFIGPKGAVTPLHVDVWGTHAWLSQIAGRKRWLLWPSDQLHLLHDCEVRVESPEPDRYPQFQRSRPLECTIGPGDTVFVPSRWAHWVVSLDPTISLTANYMGPGCFGVTLANTARDLFGNRLLGKLKRRTKA